MPGKVRAELLEHVFDRTGTDDSAILQAPANGEDIAAAAAVESCATFAFGEGTSVDQGAIETSQAGVGA